MKEYDEFIRKSDLEKFLIFGEYQFNNEDLNRLITYSLPIGEWIPKKIMIKSINAKNYYCSICGEDTNKTTKTCEKCGAIMINEYGKKMG